MSQAEAQSKTDVADVSVENHGTLFLVRSQTDAGKQWMDEHLPEDAQMFGDAVAVEHRYIGDIVRGMQGDGLTVE